MHRFLAFATAGFALAAASFLPLGASADDKALSRDEVEAIVKKVIRENPDLILRTVTDYERKQELGRLAGAAQNFSKKKDEIQNDPHSPSIGNPKGDVTVVEFFDYHCGYCKRFYPDLAKLLDEDKNVRVVFKEFPILSEDSAEAAKAALAVWNVDKSKYFAYHSALMKMSGEFTQDALLQKAKEVGVDPDAFMKAYADPARQEDIDRNIALAHNLDIGGTPALVIGTEFMPGAIAYDVLKEKVAAVRVHQKYKGKND